MSNAFDLFYDQYTTSVADLDDEYATTNVEYDIAALTRLDFDTLTSTLGDRDLTSQKREELCCKYNTEDQPTLLECINNIFSLYLENHLYHLRDVIVEFARMSFLPFPIRVKAAQSLVEADEEVPDIFEKNTLFSNQLLLEICKDVIERPQDREFNHTLLFELLVRLCPVFSNDCVGLMTRVLCSEYLEEDYRFTLFLYVRSTAADAEKEVKKEVLVQLAIAMLEHINSATRAVVLAQLIPVADLRVERLKELIRIDRDAAEICDFMLEADLSDEWKQFAKQRLSEIKGVTKNVFESSQNLHEVSVDVEGFVEKMMDFDVTPPAHLKKRFPSLEAVINRIEIDNHLYSTKALSICTLMGKCWSCIQVHESRVELEKRFAQELEDMRDTCTSGHLVRLMNVFSGWMDGVKLDVKIEIQGVVFYRLQKMIEGLSDKDREKIIGELGNIELNEDGMAQMAIQDHLFKKIAELHDEMWLDYKGLIDIQKFAEYFRNALIDFTIEKTK